jgi:hypothetical protein
MVHHHRSKDEFPQITKGKYAPGYRYTMAAPKFVRTEPLDWSVICLTSVRHCESAGTIRRRSRRGDGDSMPAHGAGGHCRGDLFVGAHGETRRHVPYLHLTGLVRLSLVITTEVPTGPLLGLKLLICGLTRNFLLLVRTPPGVLTMMKPLVAPSGSVALT